MATTTKAPIQWTHEAALDEDHDDTDSDKGIAGHPWAPAEPAKCPKGKGRLERREAGSDDERHQEKLAQTRPRKGVS